MPVELRRGGLVLQGTPLWFDARTRSPVAFVSHAHSDHIARHDRVIATAETLALMQHRLGQLEATTPLAYGERLELGGLQLECFSAGHVFGSAQVRVTRGDGHRVVYTGDVSLEPALTAAPAPVLDCETLIIESTFGHPKYRFPPRAQLYDQVADWARRQLAQGIRPILLAYSLGKSQETVRQLAARGLPVRAHPTVHDVALVYESLGMAVGARRFEGHFEDGEVGLFPPYRRGSSLVDVPRKSLAALTGWAVEPWGARRCGADLAFPISDHADFNSLCEYARRSGAREVITLHGFSDELAVELRKQGLFARAVHEQVQMELFA
ncbi:MAG: MBL fold metallo-hydrolase [Archangium gephyra]|uniref:MBL fold metallo-hydrolase n=1 Tax=Archangium gephyra TaxID=48 RepID=A0A2W5VAM4_9BACT|nr:MAG: MBL fold metallo-hydrolase [Archangium gephyra]